MSEETDHTSLSTDNSTKHTSGADIWPNDVQLRQTISRSSYVTCPEITKMKRASQKGLALFIWLTVLIIVAAFVVERDIESFGFFVLRDAQANNGIDDFEQDEG